MAPWISAARVSAAPLAAVPDPGFEPGFAIDFLERSSKAFAQTIARPGDLVKSLTRTTGKPGRLPVGGCCYWCRPGPPTRPARFVSSGGMRGAKDGTAGVLEARSYALTAAACADAVAKAAAAALSGLAWSAASVATVACLAGVSVPSAASLS